MDSGESLLAVAVVILCLCLFPANGQSTSHQNPVHAIAERNLFGLTPKPPPYVPEKPSPPLPKVKLTGITTILGNKLALLKVQFPPQPREPAKDKSYILGEGQRDGPIEVLEINEKLDKVKMDNSGTVMEITFEKPAPSPPPPTQVAHSTATWRYPIRPPPSWPLQKAGR